MEKSAEAFRTISEVAEIVDVPQHVLRFWETRFVQVRPMKRGGGRRLYRPADIDLLLGIKRLLYAEGYTIKGVQKLLKENSTNFVAAIGTGDLETAGKIAQKKQQEQLQNDLFPEDILPDQKKKNAKTTTRKFFGLIKQDEGKGAAVKGAKASTLSKDNVDALQGVLLELIECKRILDRAR